MDRAIVLALASLATLVVLPSVARARSPYWRRNCDLEPQLAKAQFVPCSTFPAPPRDVAHSERPLYAIAIEVESVAGALERISSLTAGAEGTIEHVEHEDFRGDATLVELRVPDRTFGYGSFLPGLHHVGDVVHEDPYPRDSVDRRLVYVTLIRRESRRAVVGRFVRDLVLIAVSLGCGIVLTRRRHARVPEAIALD